MYVTITTDDVVEFHEGLPNLEQLQKAVDGYIEAIAISEPFSRAIMYLNEEGKLNHLPANIYGTYLVGAKLNDVIVGNIVLVGPPDRDGNDTSLDEEWREHINIMVADIKMIKDKYASLGIPTN